MYLSTGTYAITAGLPYHTTQTSPSFVINNQQQTHNYDFTLGYLPNPTDLNIACVNPTVTITWTAPLEPVYTVTGYNVYRRYEDHPYQLVGQSASTTYTEDLTYEGTYYYYVRAVYAEGEGAPSEADSLAYPVPTSNGPEPTPVLVNALYPNYPNPFNPKTTISYSLAKPGKVTLSIYNTKGQLVKTLVSNNKAAGQYKVVWDGSNNAGKPVSSGLYFTRIETPNYTHTRKMMMLK